MSAPTRYIQSDEKDKIDLEFFWKILFSHAPQCLKSFRLSEEEILRNDQFFKNLQDKVKTQYDIAVGCLDEHQNSYASIAQTEFIKLSQKPAKYPNGIIIGEDHGDDSPKNYLVTRMNQLKKHGFTELYFEHIPASLQHLMDADWDSLQTMPNTLYNALSQQNRRVINGRFNFSDVIIAAKKAGIRVVFFETITSYDTIIEGGQISKNDPNRIPMMNFRLWERMQEIPPRGKYLALVGNHHIVKDGQTPGLGQILGGLAVAVFKQRP